MTYSWIAMLLLLGMAGCALEPGPNSAEPSNTTDSSPTSATTAEPATAAVLSVEVSGDPGAYEFTVTVRSPDTGCDQYADWWEVLSAEGELLYRRVLLHSHVDEQPFTRSGGPVAVSPEQVVIVRSHMHPSGYGTQAQEGSVATGFRAVTLPAGFATTLAQQDPLPADCAF
ncbi:hypothetical protein [Halomicronema hongdechloris]|nr:hypothetical protein [Halomicronema hongdechloris]